MCPRVRTRYGCGRTKLQAQDSESCSNDGDQYKRRRKGMKRRVVQVHKLYEKRRRAKINRKLRILQDLIPNCTKVDKASVIDEAIEYLKYLQLQLQIMPIIFGGSCVAPTHIMMLGMDSQQFFTSPYGVYGIGTLPQMPPP